MADTQTNWDVDVLTPDKITWAECYSAEHAMWPVHAVQTVVLMEFVSSIPAEVRMWMRILHRPRYRANISELLFFLIKYLAAVGVGGDLANWYTVFPHRPYCRATAWLYALGIYTAASLVPCAMAVRTYAVIKAGAARRRLAILILSGACLGHFAFTFYIMFSAGKMSVVEDHNCSVPADLGPALAELKPWQWYNWWWTLWSVCLDLSMNGATVYKLKRQCGPNGWLRFSHLLYVNSIHYMVLMTVINVIQFATFWAHNWSNTQELVAVLQIAAGLRLLVNEQDYLHGHQRTTSHSIERGYSSDKASRRTPPGHSFQSPTGNQGASSSQAQLRSAGGGPATSVTGARLPSNGQLPHSANSRTHDEDRTLDSSVDLAGQAPAVVPNSPTGLTQRSESLGSMVLPVETVALASSPPIVVSSGQRAQRSVDVVSVAPHGSMV